MSFIEINDKTLSLYPADETIWQSGKLARDEEYLIEAFRILVENRDYDKKNIYYGVNPGPDFGYFDLASRFWRASLGIYFLGTTNCFWERGTGFPEPWLFNARHSIELFLKGFLLYLFWFNELQKNVLAPGYILKLDNLKGKFFQAREDYRDVHNISKLYKNYKSGIENTINNWNTNDLSAAPELKSLLLSDEGEDILKEFHMVDETSFRFRYPSIKVEKSDYLQESNWRYDETRLLLNTGLPQKPGYFFDHVKVINSLHHLMQELFSIEAYLGVCWSYIGEIQSIAQDLRNELYATFI
jgi:hypothetical protein